MPVPALLGIILGLFLLIPVLSVVFGAFAGWIVSLFFNETVHGVLTAIIPGLRDFELWQIGAGLGFLGSFFRSSSNVSSKLRD